MNLFIIKNLDEESIVKIERSNRTSKLITKNEKILEFEIDFLNSLRKAYSYSLLNRYVLTNKELINWINQEKLGGRIIEVDKKCIDEADRVLTINLVLQGDKGFFGGTKNNVYNEIENLNPFGVKKLNEIIFEKRKSLINSIIIAISVLIGVIGAFVINKPEISILTIIVSIIAILDLSFRHKRRIKRFIAFNQSRVDFSKEFYESETGKKGKDFKYVTEKGKCYVREVGV